MNELNPEFIIGGGGCFLEDTKVLTPTGLTPIISIKVGDPVICFDDKGKLHTSKVLSTNSHENKEVYRYNLWGGSYLDATPNHWVLNADNSFIEIGKVDESIALVNASGFLTPIVSKEFLGEFTVYNLIVDTYHTYIANGIRVHNGGGGKGGSAHIPSEAPDTLKSKSYAKVLDLIQEGEIEGLVNGARSIYFNGTPLMNSDGTYNYNDVAWDFRAGTSTQSPMEGFDEIESETQESVKITKSISKTISIVDPTVDKVRLAMSIPSLFEQESDGDLIGSEISYQVLLQKNGGNGVGAIASVGTIINGTITSIPITNGGSGYPTATTTLTINGAGTGATATPTVRNGVIKTITVTNQGTGYTWIKASISGNGVGAKIEPILSEIIMGGGETGYWMDYQLTGIKVLDPGYGYTVASVVIEGDGMYAAATANISNGVIVGLNITNAGQNYVAGTTTVTATGSGGSGATFGTVAIGNGVISTINVIDGGIGYDNPTIVISDTLGAGYGAVASAITDTAGTITSIAVTSGGIAYTSANTVVSVANGGFYPVTLTDNSATITSNSTYSIGGYTFVNGYIATANKTKGLIALVNPYVKAEGTWGSFVWVNGVYVWQVKTTPLYYGYSATSKNAQFTLTYRKTGTLDAYTTIASGLLDYSSSQVFFKLEEVKKAYDTIKATNPSITLTYEQYIRNRLDAESPEAPGNIKDRAIQYATTYNYIIPVPYFTYDVPALAQTSEYQFVLNTKGTDESTYTSSVKAALYNITAYYDTVGVTIRGKTTSKYTINHTINLPRTSENDRFDIKIIRLSDDSNLSSLQNDLYFESYANIVSNKLRYPNSALIGIKIDSENFSNIPTRGYHLKLLKIKIPDNYDPINGTYNRITTEIPAATNLLTYSEEFNFAAWSVASIVTTDAIMSPDGTVTADRIVKDPSNSANDRKTQTFTNTLSTSLVYSIYVKQYNSNQVGLLIRNVTTSTNLNSGNFNFTNNTFSGSGGVEHLPDGWKRIYITQTSGISIGNSITVYLYVDQLNQGGGYGCYAWGAQVEAGTVPTPVIRTDSVSLTRPAQPVGSLAYDVLTGDPVEQLWTGNFYTAWSNNPAWCFYDLVTNDRYGLGEYIQTENIDEYTLYSIGKYCDELVPNGYGSLERRFTLNTYIQTRQEAVKLLQDMASAFRGMIYWSTGLITAVQDAAGATPVYQFNNSNVINGEFSYSGASRKVIHNAALVTWNDPLLLYKQRIEYVEDRDAIDTYGYNPTDVVAFGCTSRGQAHRMGKALLYTEKVENNLVSFKAALEASYIRPGMLIKVQDDTRSGTLVNGTIKGGRLISKTSNTLTLDRPITMDGSAGYKIRLNTINATPDPDKGFTDYLKTVEYTLQAYNGAITTVTTTATISDAYVLPNTVWTVSPPTESEELFRILGIKEADEPGTYEIAAMLHNPSKYEYIEEGLELQNYSYSTLDNIPLAVTFTSGTNSYPLYDDIYFTPSGIIQTYLSVAFNRSLYAAKYDVYLQKDTDDWVLVAKDISTTSYTIYGVKDGGAYRVKVIAKSFTNKESQPAYYPALGTTAYTVQGKTKPPSDVTGFIATVLDSGNIEFKWDAVPDIDLNYYEIRVGDTWEENPAPLKSIKATSTTIEASILGTNTYQIKAKDTSNFYSLNADTYDLTILAPSTPVVDATAVTGTNLNITWNDCKTTLPIKYYHIYKDTTTTAAATVGPTTSYLAPISWGASNIYVKAEDIAGNFSAISNGYSAAFDPPTILSHSWMPVGVNYEVNLTVSAGALPVGGVEVRYGGSSWDTGSTVLASVSGTKVTIPIDWVSSRLFRFKPFDIVGNLGAEFTTTLWVHMPSTPVVTATFLNIDNTIKLSWTDSKSILPINYYEVRQGTSWVSGTNLGKVYALESIFPVDWSGTSSTYFVKAFDLNNNESGIGSVVVTPTYWGAITFKSPAYTIVDSSAIIHWNKPVQQGSFSLSHYKIWDTNTAGAVLATSITEDINIPIYWESGAKVFCIAPVDSKGNVGTTAVTTVTISLPIAPIIDDAACGFIQDQYILKWAPVPYSNNTVPIQEYEIGYYNTAAAAVSIGRIKGTTYSGKAEWLGTREFWIKSVDTIGNIGTALDTITLDIDAPGAISQNDMQVQVVDNNVLLYWNVPTTGTLPVLTYEIREGDTWDPYDRYIGTKTGNFTTIFETQAGLFRYWIAAIDTAGNYGTPISVTTTVNQPPDYILNDDYYTDFNGANVTKSNYTTDLDSKLIFPIDSTETWQNHFTNRNWATPQEQIDDLFTLYIEPGTTTGYYEEWKDYGTTLAANKITITPNYNILTGTPIIKNDIWVSLNNVDWVPNADSWSTYATKFRYIKYRMTINAAKAATYTQSTTTATITCTAHGLIASDYVYLDFKTGASANINDNKYPNTSITIINEDQFSVVVTTSASQVTAADVYLYNSKFYGIVKLNSINVRLDSKLKTLTGTTPARAEVTGATYNQSNYTMTISKTAHGISAGEVVELDYGLTGATYVQTGTSIVVTKASHGFLPGEKVILDFTSGTAIEDYFTINATAASTFTVSATMSLTTSGAVSVTQPFKVVSAATDSFTVTNLVSKTASGSTSIDKKGTCVFLTLDRTPDSTREFIDGDAIALTPNTTSSVTAVYDFTDKPDPWFFRILLFTSTSGARTSGPCSYTVRGF